MDQSDKPDDPGQNDEDVINGELESAQWAWIAPHAKRDRVIVIGQAIELSEAAIAFAQDQKALVETWIGQGNVSKPTMLQLEAWSEDPNRVFRVRILQPWVLIQELLQ